MKTPADQNSYFFVDESGDPVFYDRRGNLIVGVPGCSRVLMLGYAEIVNPDKIRQQLHTLQQQLADDPYFKDIPSLKNTLRAFHAKDDIPEVRERVYRLLGTLDFKAQVVVARKKEAIFRQRFSGNTNQFYDYLVSRLFQNSLHKSQYNIIYYATRGSRSRQAPLQHAIQEGIKQFESKWNTTIQTHVVVHPQSPMGEPCLSVVDYVNWAVYRVFERGEMRYFNVIADKVSLVLDLYDTDHYGGGRNFYTRKNPLDAKKISPL